MPTVSPAVDAAVLEQLGEPVGLGAQLRVGPRAGVALLALPHDGVGVGRRLGPPVAAGVGQVGAAAGEPARPRDAVGVVEHLGRRAWRTGCRGGRTTASQNHAGSSIERSRERVEVVEAVLAAEAPDPASWPTRPPADATSRPSSADPRLKRGDEPVEDVALRHEQLVDRRACGRRRRARRARRRSRRPAPPRAPGCGSGRPAARWRACGTRPRWPSRVSAEVVDQVAVVARPSRAPPRRSVEMVPASPMTVLRLRATAGTSRHRSSNHAAASAMALLSSSGAGGSLTRCFSVRRTHPTSKLRTSSGCVGADHALGGPAADVDHEERPVGSASRLGGGSREAEAALLVAAQQLRPGAHDLLGRAEEVLAVAGVTGRAGGGDPHPLHAVLVHRLPVLAEHGERALDRRRGPAARWRRRPCRAA